MIMDYNKKAQCLTYSMILIDSIYRSDKSYYPQILLDERKYKVNDKITYRSITEEITDFEPKFDIDSVINNGKV